MIAQIIHASIRHRSWVLLAAVALTLAGLWSVKHTNLDALPDLSDTQVVLRISWPGQAPQIVEDQVTYPLATTMMSVPEVANVRAYSFLGDAFIYVLFNDEVDLYWARTRVLEYLSQVQGKLPEGAEITLGPDASGLGWIYEYTLVDRTGQHDLGSLTSLQNWFLRYRLKTVPDVAEVATIGGMEQAWQVVVDPNRLASHRLQVSDVSSAINSANGAASGSVIEQGEASLMVRSVGYLQSFDDFAAVPVGLDDNNHPILLGDIATLRRGPTMRQGMAELDGEGAVVGAVVILRSGRNALTTIDAVKKRISELKRSLPEGVEIIPTYDRSELIHAAIDNLTQKLLEEFIVIALACLLFLWHMRSALVAVVTLPLGVLTAFIALHLQGVSADILSLSGIAIAISAMVDAAIVMIENAHKHLEHWAKEHNGEQPTGQAHWQLIGKAAAEVGPALFISLVIITLSFLPVFALEGQEGRLFKPLAFTKTYAMAAAAALSVTLVPVLMGYLIRGRIRAEQDNPLNRWLVALYHPLLEIIRRHPLATFGVSLLVLASALWPLNHLGTEFMPAMEEGNALVYMPTTLPGLSYGKAEQLLQQTDRMLRTVPEVERVFGKVGRADSATDPAPLEMFETTITFKPRSQWRAGMTMARLQEELDAAVQVPGLVNFFVPPIRNRIDMQATGIKSPIGIKVLGPEVDTLQEIASHIEHITQDVAGVRSVLAERVASGRYVDVKIRPEAAARFGLSQAQLQDFIQTAVGGMPIGETIEGRERHPIVLRYPRAVRSSVPALESLLIPGKDGLQVRLDQVADVSITSGPAMLTSDNGMLAAYIYVDTADRALGDIVKDLQALVAAEVELPAGYTLEWSGQFEFLAHAMARLQTVIPITLVIITFLLHLVFRRWDETLLVLASLPFALVGGLWLVWALGQAVSVATIIGFIALGGVAAEFGVIMLIYLRTEWKHQQRMNPNAGLKELDMAIHKGAAQRVRPKAMTMVVVLVGLLPIMVGTGVGHEIMQRIATPMVGGMLTAPLVSMLLLPEAYRWLVRRRLQQTENK